MGRLANNVRNGVFFLDMNVPGWDSRIDISDLKMSSCIRCVLGQLFEGYGKGAKALDIADFQTLSSLGFDGPAFIEDDNEYSPRGVRQQQVLTRIWKAAIKNRLKLRAEMTEETLVGAL